MEEIIQHLQNDLNNEKKRSEAILKERNKYFSLSYSASIELDAIKKNFQKRVELLAEEISHSRSGEWIKMIDITPIQQNLILTLDEYGSIRIGAFYGDDHWKDDHGIEFSKVIAWMHLPLNWC